jgi:hypothetical protein
VSARWARRRDTVDVSNLRRQVCMARAMSAAAGLDSAATAWLTSIPACTWRVSRSADGVNAREIAGLT